MLSMRGIEERAMMLYRQGKVPGSFYDGFGQEAVSAGPAWAMHGHDRLCILHRDLAAHLIRGVTPGRIFGQYMGRSGGITGGRDGNVHFGDRTVGCVGMVSMLPDMMLVATGLAMAFKLRGERRAALTWFGDGSTSRGDFHEAMNWAGVQKLPVIFILENNQYAYSTPTASQFAVDPVERAASYGFPGVSVDGNDVEAMFEEWRRKDPIDRQARRVAELGVDVDALRAEVKATIDAAVEEALKMPMPDGEEATLRVFADEPALLEDGNSPWSGFRA
jgi:pyruvate dehydrogenase E1 component alpha subunit